MEQSSFNRGNGRNFNNTSRGGNPNYRGRGPNFNHRRRGGPINRGGGFDQQPSQNVYRGGNSGDFRPNQQFQNPNRSRGRNFNDRGNHYKRGKRRFQHNNRRGGHKRPKTFYDQRALQNPWKHLEDTNSVESNWIELPQIESSKKKNNQQKKSIEKKSSKENEINTDNNEKDKKTNDDNEMSVETEDDNEMSATESTVLEIGSEVELCGLKREAFNGLSGKIVVGGQNGRWNVKLEGSHGLKSFKPDNLKLKTIIKINSYARDSIFTFLKIGSIVILSGLKSKDFNGLKGEIVEKAENGRWTVKLDDPKYGVKSFKPDNLKVLTIPKKKTLLDLLPDLGTKAGSLKISPDGEEPLPMEIDSPSVESPNSGQNFNIFSHKKNKNNV